MALSLRDLVVLYVIAERNLQEAKKLKDVPMNAANSLARPVTIATLYSAANDDLVNRFIKANRVSTKPVRRPEEVYRSIRKLVRAGLLYPPGRPQQFAQTPVGEKLYYKLASHEPYYWPSDLEGYDGEASWTPALPVVR